MVYEHRNRTCPNDRTLRLKARLARIPQSRIQRHEMLPPLRSRIICTQLFKPNKLTMSDSHVYVRSKEHHWVPARVVGDVADATDRLVVSVPRYANEQSILSDGGKGATSYERQTIDLNDYPNKVLPLQNVDEIGFLNEEGDMVDLPFLHEVRNLIGLLVWTLIV